MQTLFINIRELFGTHQGNAFVRGDNLSILPSIRDAYLLVNDGLIEDFGTMSDLGWKQPGISTLTEDLSGRLILPAWCDSHTHLVFAGSRENEFINKIKGLSYAEIAARGGGILNSANKLNETAEDELYSQALKRLKEMQLMGTAAVEIKSGYGLSTEGELKMLRVIRRLQQHSDMEIRATFLGAHTYPAYYKNNHEGYLEKLINEMLPAIADEGLADFIDVFCEEGFFSVEETVRICEAGLRHGLKPKLHVNQLNSIGGVEAGIRLGALSLDHLETVTEKDIGLLGNYEGASTILPTAAFFLRMQYQPARQLIDAGAALTLATDYNPGSSPSGNMNFAGSLSCIQLRMLPEEVVNAATINGANAMGVQEITGSIAIGKRADFIVTLPIPSLSYYFYSFGSSQIDRVMINGNWVAS